MALKIGYVASLGFRTMSDAQVVQHLKALGYEAVEWPLARFDLHRDPQCIKRAVQAARDGGLHVSDIAIQRPLVWPDPAQQKAAVEEVKTVMKAASEAGVAVANVWSGPVSYGSNAIILGRDMTEGQAWNILLRTYEELVPLAERLNIRLAVEGIFGMVCRDYYTTRLLLDAFPSEHLGVTLDPSHYALYGNDIPWVVRQFGRRLYHVHLKDAVGVPGEMGKSFSFPVLGEGMIDWSAVFSALRDVGYNGTCSVEFEAMAYLQRILNNDVVAAARVSMERVRRFLKA